MPALNTGVSEETEELIERAIREHNFEDKSDLVESCVKYTLYNKFGMDV
jgi:hypothetical protein